ncbi:hypothetical protein OsJ_32271 [Oryza sativa Japonica Group]|uniref:Uncharacterized protein n=1 Tax=Oryza sativa subsp. japonica TaxID=39947 RepID=B9G6R4_ORYSJ|nr:hypothetical protein OsJ_32271 [Oryza sativa Japonica Group]
MPVDVDGDLGHSFNGSVVSFIDMDPAELFSMRWTSLTAAAEEEEDHDDDDFDFGMPCVAGAQCSSPLLLAPRRRRLRQGKGAAAGNEENPSQVPAVPRAALPGSEVGFRCACSRRGRPKGSLAAASSSASPARRSTSSSYASAAEYWCHGNADTAVRDAILYCKKSIGQDM